MVDIRHSNDENDTGMTTNDITFLGLGAMGRRMAARLLAAGYPLNVWNRSPGPSEALREGLAANRIQSIYGIINGTCNYILTRMREDGLSYPEALRIAKEGG
ncbi:MAG: homoserine dehydrogenase, partial [Deltaproteobacteria bacterium]|nr:homoserine dehydrogenase [Deltaproteobacteria bacterium]